jgi:hypothetical protein
MKKDEIAGLYITDFQTVPIGGDNPYYKCAHCGRSEPEINGNLYNHYSDCSFRLKRERDLLDDDEFVKIHYLSFFEGFDDKNYLFVAIENENGFEMREFNGNQPVQEFKELLKWIGVKYKPIISNYKIFYANNEEEDCTARAYAMNQLDYFKKNSK